MTWHIQITHIKSIKNFPTFTTPQNMLSNLIAMVVSAKCPYSVQFGLSAPLCNELPHISTLCLFLLSPCVSNSLSSRLLIWRKAVCILSISLVVFLVFTGHRFTARRERVIAASLSMGLCLHLRKPESLSWIGFLLVLCPGCGKELVMVVVVDSFLFVCFSFFY